LAERPGRVVDRIELRRAAGLHDLSPRRCEAVLVQLRRALGAEAIVNVRRRGWMLAGASSASAAALAAASGD